GGHGDLAQPVGVPVPRSAVLAHALVLRREPSHELDARLAVPLFAGCRLGRGQLGAGDGHGAAPEAAVWRAAVAPEGLADAPGHLGVALAPDERVDDVL